MQSKNNITIRQARYDEFEQLQSFYNENWGYKHGLVNVKQYIDYYFIDSDKLNFIIAYDEGTKEIISACGYIPCGKSKDTWTTLWLTQKGIKGNYGLQVLDYICNKMNYRTVSGNKIDLSTKDLYDFCRIPVGKLDHYYRLMDKEKYDVAVIQNKNILPYKHFNCQITKIVSVKGLESYTEFINSVKGNPAKDIEYIIKRYFEFPFYDYHVYSLTKAQEIHALIVLRKVYVKGSAVLRIVDFIGKVKYVAEIGSVIDGLLEKNACEYVDFYCYGFRDEDLRTAGFSKRTNEDENIIPGYLEPYQERNIEYYFFTNRIEDFVMCKADGDQDRLYIGIV